jgi:hypothetical protein
MEKALGTLVNTVLKTRDLNQFKFRKDNRSIKPSHVAALVKSMKAKGWYAGSYVVVNSSMEIIDGQHRVTAAKEAGVPVTYVMEIAANFNMIRNLNTNQKNWSIIDHIHGFVVEKNPHYVALENFMKEFKFLKPTDAMILTQNAYTPIKREDFESGMFKVKDIIKAREWANHILSLKPYFVGYNRAIFVRALVKILSRNTKFEFESFLHKVKLRPQSIYMCGTVNQYIEMIESIYNYKRISTDKINLRF